jgi:EAL domain-containing protein (putative c-di-GMP-specific phosphodiesterase class I)
MARQLRIRTVVADEEDWVFLHNSKCDLALGYFIGRPMPQEDFEQWFIDWNRGVKGMRLK